MPPLSIADRYSLLNRLRKLSGDQFGVLLVELHANTDYLTDAGSSRIGRALEFLRYVETTTHIHAADISRALDRITGPVPPDKPPGRRKNAPWGCTVTIAVSVGSSATVVLVLAVVHVLSPITPHALHTDAGTSGDAMTGADAMASMDTSSHAAVDAAATLATDAPRDERDDRCGRTCRIRFPRDAIAQVLQDAWSLGPYDTRPRLMCSRLCPGARVRVELQGRLFAHQYPSCSDWYAEDWVFRIHSGAGTAPLEVSLTSSRNGPLASPYSVTGIAARARVGADGSLQFSFAGRNSAQRCQGDRPVDVRFAAGFEIDVDPDR